MKKLLILFTLLVALTMVLSFTSVCFAEEEELPIAQEEQVVEETQPIVEESANTETSDNNALIWLKETWEKTKNYALGIASGVTFGAIISAIFLVAVRRVTNKAFDKIEKKTDSKTIADLSSKAILDNLSNVALDVNIKPVLMSQYKAMSEEINGELTIAIEKQDKKNLALIKCFKAFADYFKASVAISDEQKQALADTIAEAESLYANCDNKVRAKVEIKAEPVVEKKETKVEIAENY